MNQSSEQQTYQARVHPCRSLKTCMLKESLMTCYTRRHGAAEPMHPPKRGPDHVAASFVRDDFHLVKADLQNFGI